MRTSGFGRLLFGADLPPSGLATSPDFGPDSARCSVRPRMSESEGRPVGQGEELGSVAVVLSDGGREPGLAWSREAVRGGPPCSILRRTSDVEARSIELPERDDLGPSTRALPAMRSGVTVGRLNVGGVGFVRLHVIPDGLWLGVIVLPRLREGDVTLGACELGPLGEMPLRLGGLKVSRLGPPPLDAETLGRLGALKLDRLGPLRLGAEKLARLGALKLERLGPLRLGAEKLARLGALKLDRLGPLRLGAEKLARLGALKLDRLGPLRLALEKLGRLNEPPPLEARDPPNDDLDPPPPPDERACDPLLGPFADAEAAKTANTSPNTAAATVARRSGAVHEAGLLRPDMALPLLS